MGTAIYGSFDELVFELSFGDRFRNGFAPKTVRVHLGDVVRVHAADPADHVSWAGELVLRIGRIRAGHRAVVLDLADVTGDDGYDRIVIADTDADEAVADLHRRGIGAGVLVAA